MKIDYKQFSEGIDFLANNSYPVVTEMKECKPRMDYIMRVLRKIERDLRDGYIITIKPKEDAEENL